MLSYNPRKNSLESSKLSNYTSKLYIMNKQPIEKAKRTAYLFQGAIAEVMDILIPQTLAPRTKMESLLYKSSLFQICFPIFTVFFFYVIPYLQFDSLPWDPGGIMIFRTLKPVKVSLRSSYG